MHGGHHHAWHQAGNWWAARANKPPAYSSWIMQTPSYTAPWWTRSVDCKKLPTPLFSAEEAAHHATSSFGPPSSRVTWEKLSQQRLSRQLGSVAYIYEERLEETGQSHLAKSRLRCDLIAAFTHLKDRQEDRDTLLSSVRCYYNSHT